MNVSELWNCLFTVFFDIKHMMFYRFSTNHQFLDELLLDMKEPPQIMVDLKYSHTEIFFVDPSRYPLRRPRKIDLHQSPTRYRTDHGKD